MRELYYENQGTNTYLVYEVDANDSVDSMSLGMLTNNRIHGLAQTLFTQMDSQKYIKFNVSAKVSVAQFFAGAVNKKRLIGVFTGIVNAMLSAEDYMLDPASIIMDLDYIFTDVSTCETDLICIPVIDIGAKQTDLGMFFRNIMFNTQFDQTENCDHVAKIINYLNSTPQFTLNDFKELLASIEKPNNAGGESVVAKLVEPTPKPVVQPVVQPAPQPSVQPAPQTDNNNEKNKEVKTTPPIMGQITPPSPAGRVQATSIPTKDEKEISWFYLMQHYNKENAALYKAQKEARKGTKATRENKSPQPVAKVNKTSTTNDFGFAVPGQPVAMTPQKDSTTSTVTLAQQPVVNESPQQPAIPPVVQQQIPPPQTLPAYVPRGNQANFGQTTVLGLGNSGETTTLNATNLANRPVLPFLIRVKNNEKIALNKPVFRIGKEKSYVDYFIGDNTAVSRSHANIISREGEYFVVDTNSTNHTFVNGDMISSGVEVKIEHGAKLAFGNEEFEFKLQ